MSEFIPAHFILPNELFLPVISLETGYWVSNLGRVYSEPGDSGCNAHGKILRPGRSGKGYAQIVMRKRESGKPSRVHRLVAQAFLPNPENKAQVNHKNGIKTDNRAANLEWCTNLENKHHAMRTLTRRITPKLIEAATRLARIQGFKKRKLTFEQAQEIRARHTGRKDTSALAREYGVGPHIIQRIVSGDTYASRPD